MAVIEIAQLPKDVKIKHGVTLELEVWLFGDEPDFAVSLILTHSQSGDSKRLEFGASFDKLPEFGEEDWRNAHRHQQEQGIDPFEALLDAAADLYVRRHIFILDWRDGDTFEITMARGTGPGEGVDSAEQLEQEDAAKFFEFEARD